MSLVKELRAASKLFRPEAHAAADRIEQLERQRDDLLAALEKFIDSREECADVDGFTAQIVSMDDYHEAQEARIEDGKLVICLSISTLAHAARYSQYFFDCAEDGRKLRISDEAEFAGSVVRRLNLEEEDGSTPITRMLDEAVIWVSEQGEAGIEEETK